MTLRRRLDRLEAKRGHGGTGPVFITLHEAGGEAHGAIVVGGGGYEREPDETESDFIARVKASAVDSSLRHPLARRRYTI